VNGFLRCENALNREAIVVNMTCGKENDDLAREYGLQRANNKVSALMGTDFVRTSKPYTLT
jgi:hypothetical protein